MNGTPALAVQGLRVTRGARVILAGATFDALVGSGGAAFAPAAATAAFPEAAGSATFGAAPGSGGAAFAPALGEAGGSG